MDRPVTTLFMLMSLDGKISTGVGDGLDFDRDLPRVPGVAEGLHQWLSLSARHCICRASHRSMTCRCPQTSSGRGSAGAPP